jgi:REP element-mobilizing transposase RayT
MLRHFNDQFCPDNWFKDLFEANVAHSFERPSSWPAQDKLVEIICFCLVENHFHLLLQETVDGGIAKFMRRLGVGMTNHFNEKYEEKGGLFQGSYRSRTVEDDGYLQYVSAYIQIKNCFELFPGGYKVACQNFDKAFKWAKTSPHCSLGEFLGNRERAITNPDILLEDFNPTQYKEFCHDFISGRESEDIVEFVAFE